MRFYALATDFDGTLAKDGRVPDEVARALERLRASGRRSVLVTGRLLDELIAAFPRLDLFDAVVAENGALRYDPATEARQVLAPPPPPAFIADLRARGVDPLEVGSAIVSTRQPHEHTALELIRAHGLDLTPIFNKGAVMLLPSSVNKATGLAAQLDAWKLSIHNVAGIGDAENDLAFLSACELAAAVANALPSVRERCDVVTAAPSGRGVIELIDRLIDDEAGFDRAVAQRRALQIGTTRDGRPFTVPAARVSLLLAGRSGGGKSTFFTGVFEQLVAQRYQVCLIDPEGDFHPPEGTVGLGDAQAGPKLEQITEVLLAGDPLVISLLGVKVEDRAAYGRTLFAELASVHARTGRPHWVMLDEAHHVVGGAARALVPEELDTVFYSTIDPHAVARAVLDRIDVELTVGEEKGVATVARRSAPDNLDEIRLIAGTAAHRRHERKYAEGELGEEEAFYFTGPERKLHLRAGNLMTFLELAQGIDDETWRYHLDRHDYSRWVAEAMRDDDLAGHVREIEDDRALDERASREQIAHAIRERYTLPVR